MVAMNGRRALIHGFGWGALAGLVLVALMYLASLLLDLKPLTQELNEPLLSIMPGFVFGFLIDTLQHAGKVVEEFGLIVAMVVALGVLGAAASVASLRWTSQYLPFAFAGLGWLVVAGLLLPAGGAGVRRPGITWRGPRPAAGAERRAARHRRVQLAGPRLPPGTGLVSGRLQ